MRGAYDAAMLACMAIYRVFVRGRFGALDDETRTRLIVELDQHDVLAARFTPDGSLTYEKVLNNFTFRIEVRDPDEDQALARAEAIAVAQLQRAGIPYKDLRVSATDMATVWDERTDAPRGEPGVPNVVLPFLVALAGCRPFNATENDRARPLG